ncbi:hypothetical protein PFICI_11141 [Pestalotiopsis fici W106-1]|uniref:Modin n=1 Tax=Pestalotiopsis fici (strain W106-1 / CGMCC3.15140) TaxID=1229662 RepID=W3WVY7_PESFW|nr:uncharacterized protein PFICI_11141 [Pestalotiopsis fici W106-1]ETS77267.1 hypothetical protein PFICI_11141 [Pestalotiopsis fici W106-1]
MALEGGQIATIVTSVIALVVSSTALLWSTLQLFHSYLGSAKGYSRINAAVMPGWVAFKRRVFHKAEFRFGVKYDTPVFIVCSVANENFPMPNQTSLFIGDDRDTQSQAEKDPEQKDVKKVPKKDDVSLTRQGERVQLIPVESQPQKGVHTVNNEQATWITLLSALDKMEHESRKWETEQPAKNTPECPQPPPFHTRSLAVAIQRKTRSWDNMPSSITKPYATTTICHIMEMAAMLGLHWKEFDRAKENFLAEGNGFVLKSTSVSELGTVFTFQVRGASKFEGNRTIPVHQVKDLAFGLVPTIYHKENSVDESRLTALSADEFKDLKYLQMGSANELAETLISFGCSTEVSELIRKNDTNQRHLYPLAFEVLGMLGKILHVKDSFFRTVPNPTFYQWDVRYFNMSEALKAFSAEIHTNPSLKQFNPSLARLRTQVENVKTILEKLGQADRQQKVVNAEYLQSLHSALETCDEYLEEKQPNARRILSKHIQIILLCLNPKYGKDEDKANHEDKDVIDAFTKLNSAQPGDKEKELIRLYFSHVLRKIRGNGDASEHSVVVDTEMWCTLVFRSLCWLALHDFHKNDRQPKGKSELMGSRLPVYII